jgi:hypothetical protein
MDPGYEREEIGDIRSNEIGLYMEGLEIIGTGNQEMESVGFVWRLRLIGYELVVLRSAENPKNEERRLQINIKLDVKSNYMSRGHTETHH